MIPLSAIKRENPTLRIDANFFRKDFLKLNHFENRLGDCAIIRSGTTPPDRNDDEQQGVVLLKTTDIRNNVLTHGTGKNFYHISPAIAARMSDTKLMPNDVLINIVGATTDVIGRVALMPSDFPEANITQAMALIRLTDPNCVPAVLFAFLASKFGALQIERLARPTGQYNLNLQEVAAIRFPTFSTRLSKLVTDTVRSSQTIMVKAYHHEEAAQQLLLEMIGMKKWRAPEPLTYTCNSKSVFASNRIDSEYFAPARVATIQKLARISKGTIADHCSSVRELFDPNKTRIAMVRNFDVTDALKPSLDDSKEIVSVSELGSTKKLMYPGDVVISRLRSYLQQIAVVNTSGDVTAVGSSEFIVLRPVKGISPDLLMVFLKSRPVQTILRFCQEGNQHPRFSEHNLLEIPFPEVLVRNAKEITKHVKDAQAAREESQSLMGKAKTIVELAIVEGEASALQYGEGR